MWSRRARTLLAAARRVREAYPQADVRAFALIRYLGMVPDIDSMKDPIIGLIDLDEDDDARRDP